MSNTAEETVQTAADEPRCDQRFVRLKRAEERMALMLELSSTAPTSEWPDDAQIMEAVRDWRNISGEVQCSNCKWAARLGDRYDQVRCCNEDSDEAMGDVEATHYCELFLPNAEGTREARQPQKTKE